jgi:hypothetical protein
LRVPMPRNGKRGALVVAFGAPAPVATRRRSRRRNARGPGQAMARVDVELLLTTDLAACGRPGPTGRLWSPLRLKTARP